MYKYYALSPHYPWQPVTEKPLASVKRSRPIAVLGISEEQALQYVNDALASNGLLTYTYHARESMSDRDISVSQIVGVLKQGQITEAPCRDARGRWSCRFEGYFAGEGVAVVVGFDCREDGTIVPIITTFALNNYR